MKRSFNTFFVAYLFSVCVVCAALGDQFDILSSRFSGTSQSLHGVAFGNSAYVAVGDNGTILYSTDTITWIPQVSGTTNRLNSVNYGTNGFVAVGDSAPGVPGTILSSADGINWIQRTSPVTNRLSGISFGFGRYVAVGSQGIILTSTNVINWTAINTGAPYNFNAIDVGNNFVAVGDSGTIATSPDGLAWTFRSSGSFSRLFGVSASGMPVAVGESGALLTSPDGTTWTVRTSGTSGNLYAVGYGAAGYGTNQFIALGSGGVFVASPDGVNWSSQPALGTNDLNGLVFANVGFLAVGNSGTIFSGVLWLACHSGTMLPLSGVAYGAGRFLSVGGSLSTNIILSSSNGVNWVTEYSAANGALNGVAYGTSNFVAVGTNGLVLTSSSNSSWIVTNVGTNYILNAVTYGNGMYVILGEQYHAGVYTGQYPLTNVTFLSADGVSWTGPFEYPLGYSAVVGITFGNNLFVALDASDGSVYTSPEGTNWTSHSDGVPFDYNMYAVCFGNGSFVAVGQLIIGSGAQITTSNDGTNWTYKPSGGSDADRVSDYAITYGDFGFVASGNQAGTFNNVFSTSSDGNNWIIRTIGGPQIRSVAFGNGSYIGVGDSGTILRSTPTNAQAVPLISGYSSNRVFKLSAIAQPGYTYRIQISTNLLNWSDLFSFTSTQAVTSFDDTDATNSPFRFYRIKTP
jgi:hypothetical protein